MKRIYLAAAFLVFSLSVGIIEYITINNTIDTYMNQITKVETLIKEDKIKEAETIIKENAVSFETKAKAYCTVTIHTMNWKK